MKVVSVTHLRPNTEENGGEHKVGYARALTVEEQRKYTGIGLVMLSIGVAMQIVG